LLSEQTLCGVKVTESCFDITSEVGQASSFEEMKKGQTRMSLPKM